MAIVVMMARVRIRSGSRAGLWGMGLCCLFHMRSFLTILIFVGHGLLSSGSAPDENNKDDDENSKEE